MRVVVTGASGNVGTALLRRLAAERPNWAVAGICRRPPTGGEPAYERVTWTALDLGEHGAERALTDTLRGADAVVHLAWRIQPIRDRLLLDRINVEGTQRVLDAAVETGVGHVVHFSSVGAYSPGPKDRPVDETWPTGGIPSSVYSRQKVAGERALDGLERRAPSVTVTRLRPSLIFQRDAGSEIARYFLGALVPQRLVGARRAPLLPLPDAAVFQAVHADDVANAVIRILERRARGAFNLAASPVVTPERLAEVFGARRVRIPAAAARAAAAASFVARVQPTEPGWVDLALQAPVLSPARAADELDWFPAWDARSALVELLEGMRHDGGTASPALAPRSARRVA